MIGMTVDVHPIWVQPASEPVPPPEGYKPATVSLPRVWDRETMGWKDWTVVPQQLGALRTDSLGGAQLVITGVAVFLVGSLSGFAVGRRRPAKAVAAQEPLLA